MMTNHKLKRIYAGMIIAGIVFTLLILAPNLLAQPSKIVESGIVNGVPYASTDFENINLVNGNLALNFPLASLQGRGQVSHGYFLRYNSKLWTKVSNKVFDPVYGTTYQDFLGDNPDNGWNDEDWYRIVVSSRFDRMDNPEGNPCALSTRWKMAYRWKVEVAFPNGKKVEFRPTGYSDIPPGGEGDGYFNVKPDGSVTLVQGTTESCNFTATAPSNARMTYYSSDGSGLRLIFANGEPLGYVWELSMPDGTKVVRLADRQRVIDRNNNYIESAMVTLPDGTRAPGWVDQVGRYVARKADAAANEDTYYQLGFNGALLSWKVKWKTVYVLRKYTTTCNSCADNERGPVQDETAQMDFRVVDRIELPRQLGGLVYVFDYYAKDQESSELSLGWGEIKSITLPTKAKVTYSYKLSGFSGSDSESFPADDLRTDFIIERAGTISKKLVSHTEFYDGLSIPREEVWSYSIGRRNSGVVAPNGSTNSQFYWDIVTDLHKGGQVYKEIEPDGTIIERIWSNNYPSGFNYGSGSHLNAFVKTEFTTVTDAAGNPLLTAIRDFNYDKNGNLTNTDEYDWVPYSSLPRDSTGMVSGIPEGILPLRKKASTYFFPTPNAADLTTNSANAYWNPEAPSLRNLVEATEIKTGSGSVVSRTEMDYDNLAIPVRGNPTQVKTWDSHKNGLFQPYSNPLQASNSIVVSTQYDQYGNEILLTDANGNKTEITYGDVSGPVGVVNGLYPTRTVRAYGSAIRLISTASYDYYTGLATRVTDVDNNVSTETEYDALGRPTRIKEAVGTPQEVWTRTEYNDVLGRVIVRSDLETKGDGKKVAVRHLDQLGRLRLSRTLENILTEDPTDEADGIKVQTRYLSDNPYSYELTSNPYRTATATDSANEYTMGWTLRKHLNTNKHLEVETFSGPELPPEFGGNNVFSSGVITTDIDGNKVLVVDQAKNRQVSVNNALGQLTDIWEIKEQDSQTVPVIIGNPQSTLYGYRTSYQYDALNNLTKVSQGNQQSRDFKYSSLSRLVSVKHPESGLISYQYDNNGNVVRKTDGRNVITKYTYDALNRSKTIRYEGETGTQTAGTDILYDGAVNGKGRLWATVTVGVSATSIDEYDKLGRVRQQRQNFRVNGAWGPAFSVKQTHNLAGDVVSQIYPSEHTVFYSYDSSGRLADSGSQPAFRGNLGDGSPRTYASHISYSQFGDMTQERFGTDIPVYNKSYYNERGQLSEIRVGTTALPDSGWNRGAILNVYATAQNREQCWTCSGKDNNGNLRKQMIFIPHNDSPQPSAWTEFDQHYGYDQLNRLKLIEEKINNSAVSFRQEYNYDRWGNRTVNAAATSDNVNQTQFSVNTQNNRLGVPAGQPLSMVMDYDGAGNLIKDTYTGDGTRTFDAENRMTSAGTASGQIASYTYDGAGKRIKRNTGDEEVWQIYGVGGELLAEYAPNALPAQPLREYGYRNGELLVTAEAGPPRPPMANSGFELPVVGGGTYKYNPTGAAWTFAGSSGISGNSSAFTSGNPFAPEGSQVAFLQGGSASQISQSITGFKAGAYYKIVFKAAQRGNAAQPGQDFDVFVGAQYLGTFRPSGTGYTELSTSAFTASSAADVLKFVGRNSSSGDNTAFIDNVRVVGSAAPPPVNVALASQGATVTASSTFDANRSASATINGDRKGTHWGSDPTTGSGWHDATQNVYPDWLQVNFAGAKTINEIGIFTVQDNFTSPVEPTETLTFTQYGVTDFKVEYWNGSAWSPVSGGNVSANNKVWRKLTFPPISTDKIRIVVSAAQAGYSRITEVEAFTIGATSNTQAPGVRWLVTDHIGTPRMTIDETGSLAGVTRHDYLPFGEEISHLHEQAFAGIPFNRSYIPDPIRQQFTGYERDNETGLDYAEARYYANLQGRFTGIDPLLASGNLINPQSWNRYAYVGNNPLKFVDPTGMMQCPAGDPCSPQQSEAANPQESENSLPGILEWNFDLWSEITTGEPLRLVGTCAFAPCGRWVGGDQQTIRMDLDQAAEDKAQPHGLAMANDIFAAMTRVDSIETFSEVKRVESQGKEGSGTLSLSPGLGGKANVQSQQEHATPSAIMTDLSNRLQSHSAKLLNELRPLSSPLAGFNGPQNLGTTMTANGNSYASSLVQTVKRLAYERAAREFREINNKPPPQIFTKLF